MTAMPREALASGCLLFLATVAYAFWLTAGSFNFLQPGTGLGLTFNSMLGHLLRGEFDVDPAIVGNEGFERNGRVYAYWGIFFAVIRLPLALLPGGLDFDVTRLSCFVAVCLAAIFKVQTLRFVVRHCTASPVRSGLYWALLVAILFGGAQIEFLRASIYQEVCLWAGALAAAFVLLAVRGIVLGIFSAQLLCAMALTAGLALLARVSTGVGLFAALGLLLLANLFRNPVDGTVRIRPRSFISGISSPGLVLPVAILFGFFLLVGFVNYERWGNPFIFADYRLYLFNQTYPDRLGRMEAYGLFNLARVPFGILYYFFPIWVVQREDGMFLFEEHQQRLLDATELPPSSFLLSAPLLFLLLCFALWSLISERRSVGISRLQAGAIGLGLSFAGLLMLAAISMNFRYRIEFYPLIEFYAFLGFLILCKVPLEMPEKAVRGLAFAASALGVVCSHLVMVLYKLSAFGPPLEAMRPGILVYYLHQARSHFPLLAPYLPQ